MCHLAKSKCNAGLEASLRVGVGVLEGGEDQVTNLLSGVESERERQAGNGGIFDLGFVVVQEESEGLNQVVV